MTASDTTIDVTKLPPQLRLLVQLIGLSEAILLVKAHGGTLVFVPNNATTKHNLSEIISVESLSKLAQLYGGQHLQIPKYDKIALQIRNQVIQKERSEVSLRQLALQHNLSRRHVINICQSQDTKQIDMFSDSPE